MPRTLLLTLTLSIAAHAAVALYRENVEEQQTIAMGSIKAPISMTFSSVSAPTPEPPPPEPVPEQPKPVEKKPEPKPVEKPKPKDVVKIAEPEPSAEKEPVPEPVVKKEPEPKPEPEKKEEPAPEQPPEPQVVQSVKEETEVEGLSDEPVFVSKPAIRHSVQPRYPRIAKRRNQQGVVMLEVVVDTEGNSMNIKVLQSSGFDLLDKSAIAAVENWEFEPQKRNNQLVMSRVHIPVAFQLN